MDDYISRQAAIEALMSLTIYKSKREIVQAADKDENSWIGGVAECIDEIEDLPSAQPEPQWIPCSERLPGEHEWLGTKKFGTTISNEVYVTFEAPDGQRFAKHISFQNGKLSPVDEQRMKVWFKGAKPIAWMPLPEPWRGDSICK